MLIAFQVLGIFSTSFKSILISKLFQVCLRLFQIVSWLRDLSHSLSFQLYFLRIFKRSINSSYLWARRKFLSSQSVLNNYWNFVLRLFFEFFTSLLILYTSIFFHFMQMYDSVRFANDISLVYVFFLWQKNRMSK